LNFIIDAQMPVKAAVWLRSLGHDAVHLNEIDMKAAGDSEIWTLCVERGAVVITKDRDFADRYLSGQRPQPRIVWIRTGNLGRDQQVDHLARNWLRILTRLEATAPIIEVR
jgi:predicted nuclease of predicted toxin-antitoxin system